MCKKPVPLQGVNGVMVQHQSIHFRPFPAQPTWQAKPSPPGIACLCIQGPTAALALTWSLTAGGAPQPRAFVCTTSQPTTQAHMRMLWLRGGTCGTSRFRGCTLSKVCGLPLAPASCSHACIPPHVAFLAGMWAGQNGNSHGRTPSAKQRMGKGSALSRNIFAVHVSGQCRVH